MGRATPTRQSDGTYVLRWTLRLYDGSLYKGRTQARTVGEVRRRARATAEAKLAADGRRSAWTLASTVGDYAMEVSIPAIDEARLSSGSRRVYRLALDLALDHGLRKLPIGSLRYRTLEKTLKAIAAERGYQTAKQARTVLSKYLIQQLIRDDLLDANPLSGIAIDLETHARPTAERAGGTALTRGQWQRIVDHLLTHDPADGLGRTRRYEQILAKRECVRDLTLLQATTGLRIGEANRLEWSDLKSTAPMRFEVRPEVAKTRRGRDVAVLDDRVAQHLLQRQKTRGGTYVIGAPVNPDDVWDESNRSHAVADFYNNLATELDIPLLQVARSHVWRTTLNTLLIDVPEAVRAAHFGHDTTVNRSRYTDHHDTTPLIAAAGRHLRAV